MRGLPLLTHISGRESQVQRLDVSRWSRACGSEGLAPLTAPCTLLLKIKSPRPGDRREQVIDVRRARAGIYTLSPSAPTGQQCVGVWCGEVCACVSRVFGTYGGALVERSVVTAMYIYTPTV